MDYGIFFHKLDELLGLKKMDEAEQYLLDNLKAELEAEDTQAVLTVMSELIGLYRVTGRGEQSMMISDKSMLIARNAGMEGTEGYATIVLNAATAYRAAGSLERAEELYGEVVRQLEKADCKDGYRYASLYNNISILYQETGRYEQAEAELKKAFELIKSLPD
ncbi:MAG: tetratricopeptide repeat protein, partial [Lachnospiraceae bacterium]